MSHLHSHDSDCTLTDLGMCADCAVYHGDPCARCDQCGYREPSCPVYLDWLAREGK